MNTTEKTLLGTAAFAAGSAVGTFFAGRAAWRGINKAKPVGLIVLAIVAYHSFDTYRASVDNAWSRVETVVEKRAEASKAEAEAAAEAKRAADVEHLLDKAAVLIKQEEKEKEAARKAKGEKMLDEVVRLAELAKATGRQSDINVAIAAWDDMMDWMKPLAEADGNKRLYEVQRAKGRAEMIALITPKPKRVTDPVLLAQLNAKPATKSVPTVVEDKAAAQRAAEVAEAKARVAAAEAEAAQVAAEAKAKAEAQHAAAVKARADAAEAKARADAAEPAEVKSARAEVAAAYLRLDKAAKIYMELKSPGAYQQGVEAKQQWNAAKDNLARALMAN